MKITHVEAWPVVMPLRKPYTVAYQTFDSTTNIFLKLVTNQGPTGWGCAAPEAAVTGETAEHALSALIDNAAPLLCGADPLRFRKLMEKLSKPLSLNPSVRAAIDMALYDILGQVSGLPLWKLLGGYRDRIKTSVTIGVLSEDETVACAKEKVSQGFRALKLKGGLNVEYDIARVIKVRENIGKNIAIYFDANQGFSVEEALRFVEQTRPARVELLEQPTPKSSPASLGRVTQAVPIPIMADESILSLRDVFCLAQRESIDMVNIKLMKIGGISEALQLNAVARAAGLKTMVGCMDEAALGIAAGLHYALSEPNIAYADLDSHLDLLNDPSTGSVLLRNGFLFPSRRPGLGAVLNID